MTKIFILLFLLSQLSNGLTAEKSKCLPYFKHLDDRCTPIYGDSECPLAFNCENYYSNKDTGLCKYKGSYYKNGEEIDVDCALCNCYVYMNRTSIQCNYFDCPENLHNDFESLLQPGCITVPGKCCDDTICGEEAEKLKAKPKCEYNGNVYSYGRQIYPEDDCMTCKCDEGWTGHVSNSTSCKPVECNLDLYNADLDNGCYLVYPESSCCPNRICPEEIIDIKVTDQSSECKMDFDQGSAGNSTVEMYYYDHKTDQCKTFMYSGEEGNMNRFSSDKECRTKCSVGINICDLEPIMAASGSESESKYFYNKTSNQCEKYETDGVTTNRNSFDDLLRCESLCRQPESSDEAKCEYNGASFRKGDQITLVPKYSKPCVQVHCYSPPFLTFVRQSCPDIAVPPNCRKQQDYAVDCCPKIVCDDELDTDDLKTVDESKDDLIAPPSPPSPPKIVDEISGVEDSDETDDDEPMTASAEESSQSGVVGDTKKFAIILSEFTENEEKGTESAESVEESTEEPDQSEVAGPKDEDISQFLDLLSEEQDSAQPPAPTEEPPKPVIEATIQAPRPVKAGCDPKQCNDQQFKHLEGRCTPIYGDSCCPLAYNCDNFSVEKYPGYCRYKDNLYAIGEEVPIDCNACRCHGTPSSPSITCNPYDCPRFRFLLETNCTTVAGKCCPKRVCGDEAAAIKAEPNCKYNGNEYRPGSTFYPEPCTKCTCNDGWTGDIDASTSCSPVNCKFELYKSKLDSGCYLVHLENGCCGYSLCPDEITSIKVEEKPAECYLPKDEGSGDKDQSFFYYDHEVGVCKSAKYGGQRGNANRFASVYECHGKCSVGTNPCVLNQASVGCNTKNSGYYYNKTSNSCEKFGDNYCRINSNHFTDLAQCESRCKQPSDTEELMCEYQGQKFRKGDKLILETRYSKPCVSVHCIAPPRLSFIHRKCSDPSTNPACKSLYQANSCCPVEVCDEN